LYWWGKNNPIFDQLESKYCKNCAGGARMSHFLTDLGIVMDLLGMKESPIFFSDV
jgi:hypothetical protein